jgi:hypothetical protein
MAHRTDETTEDALTEGQHRARALERLESAVANGYTTWADIDSCAEAIPRQGDVFIAIKGGIPTAVFAGGGAAPGFSHGVIRCLESSFSRYWRDGASPPDFRPYLPAVPIASPGAAEFGTASMPWRAEVCIPVRHDLGQLKGAWAVTDDERAHEAHQALWTVLLTSDVLLNVAAQHWWEVEPQRQSDQSVEVYSDRPSENHYLDPAMALTVRETAEVLAKSESAVWKWIQRHNLYSFKRGRSVRVPTWQIVGVPGAMEVLPGLRDVLLALPGDLHPLQVRGFFLNAEVARDDNGEPVTALDWLASGGSPDVVARLAAQTPWTL